MSDFTSLRPPLSPSRAAGLNRASSPVGPKASGINPHSRYSLGKVSTPTENMMRLAQQQANAAIGHDTGVPSPSMLGNPQMAAAAAAAAAAAPPNRNLRPSSEMLNVAHQGTPESEAIDRWFQDLQHYEATLEEMAAASLDQSFKEELSAIEQWFRVLSEAERTAALYSLLQESTQVQIRFFITVLQQMARSDPVAALLSPSHPNSSMAEQMEAKLSSLGLKSPSAVKSPASPATRNFHRQSSDAAGFLSPNMAAMYSPNTDAASALAAQRAKLKANRTSAPGTLIGESRGFSGGSLDQVQERGGSPNPQQQQQQQQQHGRISADQSRPKSTDLSNMTGRSPRATGPLDDQLSPISATGNWSSMVNTPLVPMFEEQALSGAGEANINLDSAAAQLASLNHHHLGATGGAAAAGGRAMVDADASKFRRKSNQNGGLSQHQLQQQVQGVLSGMFHQNANGLQSSPSLSPNIGAPTGWGAQASDFSRSPLGAHASAFASSNFGLGAMSPNALAGLQSPTGGLANPINVQMMNAMAAMSGLNLNNMNAAQFLAMQQQILQNQQTVAAFAQQLGQDHSPGQLGFGMAAATLSPSMSNQGGRRSPRNPSHSGGGATAAGGNGNVGGGGGGGGAAGEDEVADLSTLEDVPLWLRHLRLHKYTPNFQDSTWREMASMDDQALQDKGVAALGARRKMLKVFEMVKKKYAHEFAAADTNKDNLVASQDATEGKKAGWEDADKMDNQDALEVDRELGSKKE